jgi:integrase/recombinase XerD
MSSLREIGDQYLELRRSLGFKLKRYDRLLPDLIEHLESSGETTVTARVALEWATRPVGHLHERQARLTVARCFARYLRTIDGVAEVPPTRLLPACRHRHQPYLYSDSEIVRLLAATAVLRPPFRAASYRTLIGLLAVTGMRIGEAIGLDGTDVDLDAGCVTVRGGKPGAARELPLHPSTVEALVAYTKLRRRHWPRPTSDAFFLSTKGGRLHYGNVYRTFQDLLAAAGVGASIGTSRPRIHDIRHAFAMRTLVDWYRSGIDVAAWMPRLSAYLGHATPADTYWYLSTTSELLGLAAARLEQAGSER